jgi:transcriptional regulator with XRE-family HTH domain
MRPTANDDALHAFAREQVKRALFAKDMTQEQLAAAIGRTQTWLSKYLRGEFNADFPTLYRMAQAFDMTLDAFCRLPDDPELQEWVNGWHVLKRPDRDALLLVLRAMTRGVRRRHAARDNPTSLRLR